MSSASSPEQAESLGTEERHFKEREGTTNLLPGDGSKGQNSPKPYWGIDRPSSDFKVTFICNP